MQKEMQNVAILDLLSVICTLGLAYVMLTVKRSVKMVTRVQKSAIKTVAGVNQILKKIPVCGHDMLVECYSTPDHSLCREQCERLLVCGHCCPLQCNQPCTSAICNMNVAIILDCGHSVSMKYSESKLLDSKICDRTCQKTLPCGHKCTMNCGQPCTERYMYE